MEKDKTICLCLIVKNEEKTLPRLIESCKAILNYWVIVDTGSNDKTIEVIHKELEGIPGDLHEKPFVDFGFNRTQLVQLAYGKADYLLLPDADFTFNFHKGFDKNALVADLFQIRYTGEMDFTQPFLVSGHKKWHYVGYTHEYLTSNDKFNQSMLPTMTVTHHGDGGMRGVKFIRDLELCTKEIVDFPNRPRPHFYLAQTHQNMGHYQEAFDSYSKRVHMGGWGEEIYYSLYQMGFCLLMLDEKDSAILQLQEAYDFRPSRFESLYTLGTIYRQSQKYSLAKIFLDKASKIPYPKNDMLFIHKTQFDYLIDFELGICNYWLGHYKESEKHIRKVMAKENVDQGVATANKKNYEFTKAKLALKKSNKNDVIYASMYTHGTSYEKEVEVLKASFDKFNMNYRIVDLRPQGSWVKNTQMKPDVIKSVMENENKDVVWIDADAEVKQYPEIFDTIDADIAFHTMPSRKEMLTGTVYFKKSYKVRDFLNRWSLLGKSSTLPDAMLFQQLLADEQFLAIKDLPASYTRIFDAPEMEGIPPVIVHNQASRRFKAEADTGLDQFNITYMLLKNKIHGIDTCSVIGNGPFNSDLSMDIDNSFVFRCNNFRTGEDFKKIGSRIDVNISSLYHEIIPTEVVSYPIFGVLPISDTLYQRYSEAKEMHKHWHENSLKLINQGNIVWTYDDRDDYTKLFADIASKISAFPTVGILGIATARELGFKKIILSGFTFFQTEKSHYWSDIAVRPSVHHNVQAERELIKHWVDNDDIEYILDATLKEKLYQYETAQ